MTRSEATIRGQVVLASPRLARPAPGTETQFVQHVAADRATDYLVDSKVGKDAAMRRRTGLTRKWIVGLVAIASRLAWALAALVAGPTPEPAEVPAREPTRAELERYIRSRQRV